jgi:hypothetical protein
MCLVAAILLLPFGSAGAAERKELLHVDTGALTKETQVVVGGDHVMNFVWVINPEFWKVSFSKEKALTKDQITQMTNALDKYVILVVVRAEISPEGAFSYAKPDAVFDSTKTSYINAEGKEADLPLERTANGDAQNIINAMKPILVNAIGAMGANCQMFVIPNEIPGANKPISAYDAGKIKVTLAAIGNNPGGVATIDMPLDALYVPRKCAKCSKEAHISWMYCPICGTKLEK